MIRTETVIINNQEFIHTWSDANRSVVREGVSYAEAYDPSEFGRTYIEGELLDGSDSEEVLDILIGNI